jgi:hypothetical protein
LSALFGLANKHKNSRCDPVFVPKMCAWVVISGTALDDKIAPRRLASYRRAKKITNEAEDSATASLQTAIATIVLAIVTAACGVSNGSKDIAGTREIVRARGQLDDHMAECTKRYGYDPEAASKLGSNVLGPGEREWRGCVYLGVEKYLIPRTLSPDVYRRAITEDRKMTEAVANGEVTRAQRQARVQQMFEEIDRIENANRAKLEMQTMDRLEMEVREDMRRRGLSPLRR